MMSAEEIDLRETIRLSKALGFDEDVVQYTAELQELLEKETK